MTRILVVGSSNTDMVVRCGHLPTPGETVIGGEFKVFAGGKGANQAVAAARAGGHVTFVAAVGTDTLGDQAIDGFTREGIDVSLVKRTDAAASGVALIMVGQVGENLIAVAPGANSCLQPEDMDRIPFHDFGYALFQLEIPLDTVQRGLDMARKAGCTTILNPAPACALPDEILALCDYLTPNRGELQLLAGLPDPHASIDMQASALIERGVRQLLVTCGADGVVVVSPDRTFEVSSPRVNAVDTVGAGDCFNGAVAVALSEGMDVPAAAGFACRAAALSVQKEGAQSSFPDRAQIREFCL